jgi:hypothetical protein
VAEAAVKESTIRLELTPKERLRLLQIRWDGNRCEIGWRWSWLQLQLKALDDQISEHDVLLEQVRAQKVPFEHEPRSVGAGAAMDGGAHPDGIGGGDPGCSRARPLRPQQKRRRLIKASPMRPKTTTPLNRTATQLAYSDRNAIRLRAAILDRKFHLFLSLLSDAPPAVLGKVRVQTSLSLSFPCRPRGCTLRCARPPVVVPADVCQVCRRAWLGARAVALSRSQRATTDRFERNGQRATGNN